MGRRLVVVGGGIAGLAGARRALLEAARLGMALEVTLLEAGESLGGKILTERVDGAVLEWGPDSFLAAKPRGRDLVVELGLERELVAPGPAASGAYLLLDGRLRRLPPGLAMGVPRGPSTLVRAAREGILTPRGAARAAMEPLVPRGPARDGSVAEVAARRLGVEAADRLVGPLVAGVYGSPPDRLGMAAVFPELAGPRSLALAARRRPRGAGPVFLTLREGMGRLVERLEGELGPAEVRTGVRVIDLAAGDGRLAVRTDDGELEADAVLLAAPSPEAAALLEAAAPEAAGHLREIEWVPSAVIHLRYEPGTIGRPLDAAGYLVALEEPGVVRACSWIPAKWPHLAGGGLRLRAVVTGAAALELGEGDLLDRTAEEVGAAVDADAPPVEALLRRWERAMPVYAPGHRDRLEAARRALPPHVAVAGASFDGVGVPDCARSGEEAARGLLRALEGSGPGAPG